MRCCYIFRSIMLFCTHCLCKTFFTDNRRLYVFMRHENMEVTQRLPVTGLRGQEIVALAPEHIETDGSIIHVRQAVKMCKGKAYIGETKSEGSNRDIPVPSGYRSVAKWLRDHAGTLVWEGKTSGQPLNLRNFRRKYMDTLRCIEDVRPLTAHCCRHTYFTHLQNAGVDMETIRILAGHAEVEMTEGYLHVQEETKQRAADKLERIFTA